MSISKDIEYMKKALKLARGGEGRTSPNPMVGAVLVKRGKIIGKGYHKKAGLSHAEIEAFDDALKKGYRINGSTLYVTLEPCCHKNKRTPPCTKAIYENGIKKVFIGTLDPNPEVSGKGKKYLRSKGIKVESGILENECRDLNEFFNKYIVSKKPFVLVKMAITIDGKIASKTGNSKWIGTEKQRYMAHILRSKVDGIVVGINTVLKDNPSLNVRVKNREKFSPVPIILDSKLKIPYSSKLFKIHKYLIVATTSENRSKIKKLEELGVEIIKVKKDGNGRVSIKDLLKELGRREISSVMVEGGSTVATSFFKQKLVDKVNIFISPKILGGDGISMIGELNNKFIKDSINIDNIKIKRFGNEFMVEGYIYNI